MLRLPQERWEGCVESFSLLLFSTYPETSWRSTFSTHTSTHTHTHTHTTPRLLLFLGLWTHHPTCFPLPVYCTSCCLTPSSSSPDPPLAPPSCSPICCSPVPHPLPPHLSLSLILLTFPLPPQLPPFSSPSPPPPLHLPPHLSPRSLTVTSLFSLGPSFRSTTL